MTAGYSGTPLARKLSLKEGMRVWRDGMPDSVADEIAREGLQLELLHHPAAPIDAAHIFVTDRGELKPSFIISCHCSAPAASSG